MLGHLMVDFAQCRSRLARYHCLRSTACTLAVLALLPAIRPTSVFAGLSFSGDVTLNTGIPLSPVIVGRQTVGSLRLDNGTTFTSGPAQFGTTPTGVGVGVVHGERTTWNMPFTDVGLSGLGRLNIEEGALVDTMRLTIGGQPTGHGTVNVDGDGSILQVRGPLVVGGPGTSGAVGHLAASNGAIVNAMQTQFIIGRGGRLVLDDGMVRAAALMNEGLVSGSGELQLASTGTFNQPGRIEVGEDDHLIFSGFGNAIQNSGLIKVDGGQLEIARPVTNVRQGSLFGGEITLRNGTLRVGSQTFDGSQLSNSSLLAAIGGENHFYGRVQIPSGPPMLSGEIAVTNNSVLIFHDDVTLQGGMMTVFAGSKATLLEDLSLASGSMLLADISDSSVDTEYGEIEVVGNVQLGGSVRPIVSDDFTPSAGDSFKIITALGGISGDLTLDDAPQLPNRLMWDLDIGANEVALNIVEAPAGDYNTDGVVDAGDYIVWRKAAGQTGSGLAADGNGDGVVDTADYDYWRANFDSVLGRASSNSPIGVATGIPEPSTAALLVLGVVAVVRRTRQ